MNIKRFDSAQLPPGLALATGSRAFARSETPCAGSLVHALNKTLPADALHEVFATKPIDRASGWGFALLLAARLAAGRSLFFVRQGRRGQGQLYPPGLAELGMDPELFFQLHAPDTLALLRATADIARSGAAGAVLAEIEGNPRLFDLTASRRLALAAEKSGTAVLLFIGLLLASRWVLPRLFHEVAAARSPELFVTLALVIVLLTAWLTHVLGLSMALGAFLAGMLLGESHYRHQIEADIRPFRDILLGLFFVSVGMLIDLQQFATEGWLILAVTLGLMLIKGSVVALLVKLRGADNQTAWRSGLALAQGGEFCFALMAQIVQAHLLPGPQAKLLLAATFCSMALTPLLLRAAPALAFLIS